MLTGRSQWHSRALLRLSLTGWVILSVVGVAQLLVVLDATIVNIALPSAYLVVHHTGPLAPSIAATRGYTLAFVVSAGVLGPGAILAVVLLPSRHRLAELRNVATAANCCLRTVGARSGQAWLKPVMYPPDGGRCIGLASKDGADGDPAAGTAIAWPCAGTARPPTT